jgi:hypothetical protein
VKPGFKRRITEIMFFCAVCRKPVTEAEVDCDDWEEGHMAYVTVFCHDDMERIAFCEDTDAKLVTVFESDNKQN